MAARVLMGLRVYRCSVNSLLIPNAEDVITQQFLLVRRFVEECARSIVNSTSARIGLVAIALIFATALLVVVDVNAPKRTPTLEVWLLMQILALGGTAWANAPAFTSVESRAKRMIARVAASVVVWLALVLGSYIVGVNLKLALGASL
jgi:hypothetical protein